MDLVSFLAQVPVVGIFVLFVLIWSDKQQKAMDQRDELMRQFFATLRSEDQAIRAQDREVLSRLVDRVEGIATLLEKHDSRLENHSQSAERLAEKLEDKIEQPRKRTYSTGRSAKD